MERYFCTICNKKYASYQNIWNHNKKFHRDKEICNSNIIPNSSNIIPDSSNIIPRIIEKSSISSLQC